jgi:hypothetical protein
MDMAVKLCMEEVYLLLPDLNLLILISRLLLMVAMAMDMVLVFDTFFILAEETLI